MLTFLTSTLKQWGRRLSIKLTKKLIELLEPQAKPFFKWDAGDGSVKGFGINVHPTGKKTFIAQFRIGIGRAAKSKRVTIGPFGTWTVDQARTKAAELIREGQSGIDRQAINTAAQRAADAAKAAEDKKRQLSRNLRIDRLAARFMREHVKIKRKGATESFYRHVIISYIFPAFKMRDAREITRGEVTKLHSSLVDKPVTANRVLSVLSAIYGYAEQIDLLPENIRRPTFRVEKYKENAKERFLSIDELQKLGAAIREAETVGIAYEVDGNAPKSKHAAKPENRFVRIDGEAAAALRLLIFTGARLREILNLTWQEVDLERGLLRLKDSKTGPKTILLNGPARSVLVNLERRNDFIFPGEGRGGQIQPRTDLKRPWKLVTKAAGLEGVRIHDLRHSFASAGATDGHGLMVIGKLLGHSQSSTTERYAHLADDPLRQASDRIASRIASAMGELPNEQSADVIAFKSGGK